jgi:hypothetical protein
MSTHPLSFFTHENLCKVSRDYLLLALFPRSRSEAFKWAIEIARNADLFAEEDLETMNVYAAGFVATKAGAEKAIDLMHYIRGWKGAHFYAQGRMVIGEMPQAFHLEGVLKCFADSCSVRDYRAHCFRLIDDPCEPLAPHQSFEHVAPFFRHFEAKAASGTYVFPCRYMLQWFRAQRGHPASVIDQIQAEGVEKFCDACPRFEPNDFGVTAVKRSQFKD